MFCLTEPSEALVDEFIASQRELPFSYPAVGATNATPPDDYTVDHNRVRLGHGAGVYKRAVSALRHWKQFDLGWVTIVPPGLSVEVGTTVAVKARAFGSWSLSAARVVYLVDDDGPVKRFGFAYGTLPDHVERGEERFTVEWRQTDDSVWYDILAFFTSAASPRPAQFSARTDAAKAVCSGVDVSNEIVCAAGLI